MMVEFRRTLKCAGCGRENSLYISSDIGLNELLIFGRCVQCGNSLQLNYNLVDSGPSSQPTSSGSSSTSYSSSDIGEALPSVPIDDSMMKEDIPSEEIKDLIDG